MAKNRHFLYAEFDFNARFVRYKYHINHSDCHGVFFLYRQLVPLFHRLFQRLCVNRFTLTTHGLHFLFKFRFLLVQGADTFLNVVKEYTVNTVRSLWSVKLQPKKALS